MCLLLLAVLVPTALLFAQSKPPSPTPGKVSQKNQNQRQGEKGPAQIGDQTPEPVVINQYFGQPEQRKLEDNKNKSGDGSPIKYIIDLLLMLATAVLAAATIALWRVARLQWETMKEHKTAFDGIAQAAKDSSETAKATAEAAKTTADEAKRTADSMVSSERAWVLVTDIVQAEVLGLPVHRRFAFNLVNGGKTIARLVDYREGFKVLIREREVPPVPDYGGSIPNAESFDSAYGYVLAPGERQGMREIRIAQDVSVENADDGSIGIYAYGRVVYYDFAERVRELHFGYKYIPNQGWQLMRELSYNKHT